MEQTVNTFSKGLLMDTHPMVLGNDTLSNALNATFITMNGNEVILQNDTGNRRVDSAFLPAGYEPVGMKEYGGIIYVASYNPITNKGQIGSFPSPQLNYGNVENIGATIDESFFEDSFEEDKFGDIKFLKNFFILSPFREEESTKDLILHSGDKFCVYFDEYNSSSEEFSCWDTTQVELKFLLTNYNNIYTYTDDNGNSFTKLYSPKNKKYTLLLGVLNSLNEFVDFTSSLLRWDENDKIIKFDKDTPEYIKFNTGYFIPNSFNSINLAETLSDSEFIKSRLKLPANTYSYKLAGPLYIKKTLNTISNVTYTYYGLEINIDEENPENNTYSLILDIFYEYNCPDLEQFVRNIYPCNETGKYACYEEWRQNNDHTNPFSIGSHINIIKYNSEENNIWSNVSSTNLTIINDLVVLDENDTLKNFPKYDLLNNIYRVTKNYKYPKTVKFGELYALRLIPLTLFGLGIRNLSYLDIIDVSKLKTTDVNLVSYGFKKINNNGNEYMEIRVGFSGYISGKGAITNREIIISDSDDSGYLELERFTISNSSGINGERTFTFDINLAERQRRIFLVTINWDVNTSYTKASYETASARQQRPDYEDPNYSLQELNIDLGNINNSYRKTEYRWLITTDLLNDFYNTVPDYGNTNNADFKKALIVDDFDVTTLSEGQENILLGLFNNGGKNLIFSTYKNSNAKIMYGLYRTYTLNNLLKKLELSNKYPIEITGKFELLENLKTIKLDIFNEENNLLSTIYNINEYKNKNKFLLEKYNEYETTGFNSNIFTVTKNSGDSNIIDINYDNGKFLIQEYLTGKYILTDHKIEVENIFRSIFETELTEEKLFNVCGSVGLYCDSRLEANFTFLKPERRGNILRTNEVGMSHNRYYGYYYNQTSSEHNEIEISPLESKPFWDVTQVVENLLTDEKFYNEPEAELFVNKNFIIGVNDLNFYTSYKTLCPSSFFTTPTEKDYIKYVKELELDHLGFIGSSLLKVITLWMRTNNGWSILPLKNLGSFIYTMGYINNKDYNYKLMYLERVVTGKEVSTYGIIGNDPTGRYNDNFNNGSYDSVQVGTNENVLKYLKNRIKDFYYINNIDPEYIEGLYKISDINEIILEENNRILLKLSLGIKIKSTITENLRPDLKLKFSKIFSENNESSTVYVLKDRNVGDPIAPYINKLTSDEIENTNNIKYILYDYVTNKYYLNSSVISFLEGEYNKNSIFIKSDGKFKEVNRDTLSINHFRINDDNTKFPIFEEQLGYSGIGAFRTPTLIDTDSSDVSLLFDFMYDSATGTTSLRKIPIIPKELLVEDYEKPEPITVISEDFGEMVIDTGLHIHINY